MAKPKIKHTISKKEWDKKHKDFKLMGKDGIPYIMMYDSKIGTHLVPVKIIDESLEEMDINDPIMMKLRAVQMRKNKEAAKKIDTEKQNKNAIKIKALKKKRAEVMRDMEQEAEPEGGKIADRYGKLLNKIDNDIIKLGGNPMTEAVEPHIKKTADILKLDAKTVEKFASTPTPNGPINMVKVLKLAKMANDAGKRNLIKYIKGEAPATNKKSYDKHLAEAKDVETYHKSFTNAAEAAKAYALKKGYLVDEDDWQSQVAFGGKYSRSRPGVGKTHSFSVGLLRNGKPQRKALHFSVYGMESGNFELTAYVN